MKIKKYITADDIIACILSFIKEEKIPLDSQKIHSTFYSLKKQFPDLLNEFSFSENDVYPYSKLLERVLFRLQNSDLISTINPEFRVCIITKESKQFIQERILPLFDESQQKKLKEMAKLFEQYMLE
jgi:hypothetical protein